MKKIMLSMAAIAFILVSCEKDENYSTAPSGAGNQVKMKNANDKSGEIVNDELSEYMSNLFNNEVTNPVEFSKNVLYSESYVNWMFSHIEQPIDESIDLEFYVNMEASFDGTEWIISPSNVELFNENLIAQLDYLGENTTFEEIPSGNKFFVSIDLEAPESINQSNQIKVTAFLAGALAFPSTPPPPAPPGANTCPIIGSWYGYHKGRCPSGTGPFVASLETSILNNRNCISNGVTFCPTTTKKVSLPNNGIRKYYYVKTLYNHVRLSPSNTNGHTQVNFLWIDFVANACGNASVWNGEMQGMLNYADQNRPVHNNKQSEIDSYLLTRSVGGGSSYVHYGRIMWYNYCNYVYVDKYFGNGGTHALKPMF
jgi:hypothetical protein